MEPLPSSLPSESSPAAFWPEALRDAPREEPFPWRPLLIWLVPGAVAAVLLLALGIILRQQTTRQIVFVSPEGQLMWTHADPDGEQAVGTKEWYLHPIDRSKLEESLPVMAGPVWAPQGGAFAATVTDTARIKVALFTDAKGEPTLISSETADAITLPAEGWSPDGAKLALLEGNGDKVLLTLVDIQQQKVITTGVTVDTRAPLVWRPGGQGLLLTTRSEEYTPTLTLVTTSGPVGGFPAEDGQKARADGAWSPDGEQVAYIVPSRAISNEYGLLGGSIWLANANTGAAQQLVPEGVNFAPVWAPSGNAILFTRFITQTRTSELYRMDPDGKNLTKIGPGSLNPSRRPFDRRRFLNWSPDGQRMFFVASEGGGPIVYVAAADGGRATRVRVPCSLPEDLNVLWAPTSRGILISCATDWMLQYWVDEDKESTTYYPGTTPAWEP